MMKKLIAIWCAGRCGATHSSKQAFACAGHLSRRHCVTLGARAVLGSSTAAAAPQMNEEARNRKARMDREQIVECESFSPPAAQNLATACIRVRGLRRPRAPTSSAAMSQEGKARELIAKAEKRLASWSLFGSSSSKFEDASEMYAKAANLFKVSKACESTPAGPRPHRAPASATRRPPARAARTALSLSRAQPC